MPPRRAPAQPVHLPGMEPQALKVKPMVEGCNWKQARHLNFAENERARTGN